MKKKYFKQYFRLIWLISVFIVIIFFIIFNYKDSKGILSIEYKNKNLGLEIYNDEKVNYGFSFLEKDENGDYFRWSSIESELIVRVKDEKIVIPIFNKKPDIAEKPIIIKVYLYNKIAYEYEQKSNDLFRIVIDLKQKGIERNDFLKINFFANNFWTPKQYGLSNDTREISFGLKKIYFIK